MKPLVPLVKVSLVALLLSAGAATVQEGTLIQRGGEGRFVGWTDDDLGDGDAIRNTEADLVWTLADDTEWWLDKDSEMVHHSARLLELVYGEMEVIDERATAKDRFTVMVDAFDVILEDGGAQIRFLNEKEVQIDAHSDFDRVDIEVRGINTGFRMRLYENQLVSLFYDPKSDETRISVPEESVDKVEVELAGNALRVASGDVTKQELFLGTNRIGIPPGVDVVIEKAFMAFPSEGEAPVVAAGTLAISAQDLDIPEDEPYQDTGDVVLVANVSPSQP